MESSQSPDEIRKVAMDLDNAVEAKGTEFIFSCFSDDCEMELLGVKLAGKEGARKWINWLYRRLAMVKFLPVTLMAKPRGIELVNLKPRILLDEH